MQDRRENVLHMRQEPIEIYSREGELVSSSTLPLFCCQYFLKIAARSLHFHLS